ncbi:cell division protein ZapE (plasmid) [Morganella morganii]|uniref:Cell division protein ZapE n=1 Tax=Morganella morganii TaxID=582 RepID=A0A433ZQG4_MORMO|nr:cell division protein ZapE [Morganella morganii]RUT64364.1 cell division protein ZapE [Morganella morganii]
MSTTPCELYQQALNGSGFAPDDVQRRTVDRLTEMHQALLTRSPCVPVPEKGLRGTLRWLKKAPEPVSCPPVQGIYMWGGVGRGKTWLMDLFYDSLPGPRKLRLHFHRFMLRVHEELTALQGHENPLESIADGFAQETDVLCFDEFFVSDITDAMILGTLLEALFQRGIALVATSNIPPDDLYRNGLQRARFLPAIEQIKKYCDVLNVDAGIDYRLRTLTQAHLWLTPADAETSAAMDNMFSRLTGGQKSGQAALTINHRPLPVVRETDGVLAVTFRTLCEDARSQLDYIALSKIYHTVLLYEVPVLTTENENAARRFLALVDEFYERKVKLIIQAQTAMDSLYQGQLLSFEFARCLSRLQEMQSEEYLKLPHLV